MTASRNDPAREARLKAALKANIARRKSQARARAQSDDADEASEQTNGVRETGDSTGGPETSSREDRA
ncbi:hypothetical protein JQU17_18425 [Ponticoccus sp. SC2-23]|uniref:hypothetical protein n=1 Tax=Alexandriicola marinus TaxID=2081710 RepID=UPI000FDBFE80|nr:hypothetical protein [Alexandriicola marinus]MBM1222353.1 hypothetical protein [Ponticoccus sp. SC6-9]MBM1224466.1 hypothetical protein [Ponticoccus sp. SC6-15]MBM1229754.1 hypothetical protein [Ponticoccus sp. SC6-38]MBM1233432.1 hypothetical protein [Ponticoccus sp. SC6-45]MBM1236618.1 hypothetical protein [Ponticoccus sp. SC6-49]MBM1244662.1 hypothetical protein [Ponticoccus sp. SC2-64]MBM1246956.1 hypothetical protein [Ponticoccus sp. SC6-42]MBM1251434.1 hypothetical protein [Pontico